MTKPGNDPGWLFPYQEEIDCLDWARAMCQAGDSPGLAVKMLLAGNCQPMMVIKALVYSYNLDLRTAHELVIPNQRQEYNPLIWKGLVENLEQI